MSENKWKSKLLSSGVPLEYEVSKQLVKLGFAVNSDYKYTRIDEEGHKKDFSIDIEATGYPPFNNHNKVSSILTLLIECKYTDSKKIWLFFPDPNENSHFCTTSIGVTIRAIDDFATKKVFEQMQWYLSMSTKFFVQKEWR